mmetsp:Transcript_4008/g.8841  ORF Transcript_4008/g.8841 Transcript_4008/m.8841 type:complete len:213 (+) Transcript_4008:375-1013(+)
MHCSSTHIGLGDSCVPPSITTCCLSGEACALHSSSECATVTTSSAVPCTYTAGTLVHFLTALTGLTSSKLKPARSRTCFLMYLTPTERTIRRGIAPGSPMEATKVSASLSNDAYGESAITTATSVEPLFIPANISAVAAPMECPQSAILLALQCARRYSTASWTSNFSYTPSEMYSPWDKPEPDMSNASTPMPYGSTSFATVSASSRHDPLP